MKIVGKFTASKWLALFVGVLLTLSCDPEECFNPKNRCSWYVKNQTTDTLQILTNFYINIPQILPPNSAVHVYGVGISRDEEIDDMFGWILDAVVIDETFTVSDTKGEELKMWTESQRNEFGRQFFNETYWKKQKWEEGKYVFHKWIFELLPEDIK